jgi:transcriptional regulator with XRE-family HTH domain
MTLKYGAVMRAVRQRRGLNQEELAARMNMSQSDISKFENDRKIPDMATMMMWAEQTCAKEVLIAFLYGMDMEGVKKMKEAPLNKKAPTAVTVDTSTLN